MQYGLYNRCLVLRMAKNIRGTRSESHFYGALIFCCPRHASCEFEFSVKSFAGLWKMLTGCILKRCKRGGQVWRCGSVSVGMMTRVGKGGVCVCVCVCGPTND